MTTYEERVRKMINWKRLELLTLVEKETIDRGLLISRTLPPKIPRTTAYDHLKFLYDDEILTKPRGTLNGKRGRPKMNYSLTKPKGTTFLKKLKREMYEKHCEWVTEALQNLDRFKTKPCNTQNEKQIELIGNLILKFDPQDPICESIKEFQRIITEQREKNTIIFETRAKMKKAAKSKKEFEGLLGKCLNLTELPTTPENVQITGPMTELQKKKMYQIIENNRDNSRQVLEIGVQD